ncbi:uncharacterized protein LOC141656253 [Silene latifolia]|uniref:uncharacterized protein LOC141656253 n=1 Tax=Silene latifolia TaxID=37657 RepID=UPI003D76A439
MVRRVNSRTRRRKSGENGKNKAPRQENKQKKKKKNDLDTSYLADKTSSDDDDSMVSIPKKVINNEKAVVKRRKFSRDPRLGAAERIRESFREVIEDWDAPLEDGVCPDYSDLFDTPGIDMRKEDAEWEDYCKKKNFPKSGEEWFAKFDVNLKDLEENEEEYLTERDHTRASQALKFYNDKHSTNYVLEETLGSYSGEFDDGFWAHCNFRAKNTTAGRRPVSRLFFAELFGYLGEYEVDSCVTLDGPGRCRDVVHGCEICPKWVRHPVNEFKNGHPDEYTIC